MCSSNTVRESSHISFFCAGDPFCEVVQGLENTHGVLTGLLERPADLTPSLEPPEDLCLQSKITDLTLSFQVPCRSMNILFASRIFLFMAGYWNLHTSGFFPVLCWCYLRTEISVTLSIGNKLYSLHHILYFSFLWKHFVDVICVQIESAKLIVAS